MKFFICALTLMCITLPGATQALADDEEFDKIMIQRKRPVYREAAPERSYQDDDSADYAPPPKAKKAKKTNNAESTDDVYDRDTRSGTSSATAQWGNFLVSVSGCQKYGPQLTCRLAFHNNGANYQLDMSREFEGFYAVDFNNNQIHRYGGHFRFKNNHDTTEIRSNTSESGEIQLDGLNPGVNMLKKLKLKAKGAGNDIEFHNIPLSIAN